LQFFQELAVQFRQIMSAGKRRQALVESMNLLAGNIVMTAFCH